MPVKVSIECKNCKSELYQYQRSLTCPQCSANTVEYNYEISDKASFEINPKEKGIWRYSQLLPKISHKISLGEGQIPIRKALHLFKNKLNISIKNEGKNPTGSFLDRISPLLISDAVDRELESVVCASDGNLGASLSAYCAAAQLKCYCVVPKSTAPEKRTQMAAYGAEVVDYGKTIDDSLELAKKMIEPGRYQATPEFNILAQEGSKTIAFEIAEQIVANDNEMFEYIVVPMGSGSLLYSMWRGFKQAKLFKLLTQKLKLPKIIGVQAEGFDPITKSYDSGEFVDKNVAKRSRRKSVANAILVHDPIYGEKAIQSINESNGTAVSVSEKEIINASKLLGQKEGIFAELSSATVVAAIDKLLQEKFLKKDSNVLLLITASGLKTSGAFHKSTSKDRKIDSFRSMGTKIEILEIINSEEANFGYSIWKELGQTISLQAVYQHLKELSQRGFTEEMDTADRQKRYALTTKGKNLIKKMKELEQLLS